jgi:hypothetical protein
VDGASTDAWFSSSLAAGSGVAGVAMSAGSGPGVVWLVFLFFLFFFFFFFFSSFFSSASLGRKEGKEFRRKVSQVCEAIAGVLTWRRAQATPSFPGGLRSEAGRRRLVGRPLAVGSPRLGPPASMFGVELGAALGLQAG